MDPFLEEAHLWESSHNRYIDALDEALSAQVRPHFYVEEQLSVYIVDLGVTPRSRWSRTCTWSMPNDHLILRRPSSRSARSRSRCG